MEDRMTPPRCRPAAPSTAGLLAAFAVAVAALAIAAALSLGGAPAALADPGDVIWRDLSQRAPGGYDTFAAVAVSPSGAVCAAGSSTTTVAGPADVLVRAYAPGGAVAWRRVWTWPGRSDDAATAVARDRRGSFVVAGSSGSNWLLLKYSAGGYLQWVRRGRGSFARASFVAVAVDGSGSVYAAGSAAPSGSGDRLLLRKYSSDGSLRWQRTIGATAGESSAAALALGGGDVYVTGKLSTGAGSSAALTARYSTGGARRWMRQHAADATDAARATGVAFAGGPVICGWGGPSGGDAHGFVVRYDDGGTPLWTGTCSGSGITDDRFAAIASDAGGRVCVTGTAVAGGGSTALTACFGTDGAPLWSLTGPGEQGLAVCRTGEGFAFASGATAFGVSHAASAVPPAWQSALSPADYADFRPAALQAAGGRLYAVGSAAAGGGGRAALVVRYHP
jgi:hypothetical protein